MGASSEGTRLRLQEGFSDGEGAYGWLEEAVMGVAGLWVLLCFSLCLLPDHWTWSGQGRMHVGCASRRECFSEILRSMQP